MRMDMVVDGESRIFYGTTFDVLHWLSIHPEASYMDVVVGVVHWRPTEVKRLPVPEYILNNSPRTVFTKLMDPNTKSLTPRERDFIDFVSPTGDTMSLRKFRVFWSGLNERQRFQLKIDYGNRNREGT